ncbi:MAG: sensor histidine kinase [Candidatus Riflebacteria bacterium]|nr:sensor histidine kinase [Candidatus Riflebacteria bacterium]
MEFKDTGKTFFAPSARSAHEEMLEQEKLLAGHDLLFLLLNNMPEFIFILNTNRQIVFVNNTVLKLTGAKSHLENRELHIELTTLLAHEILKGIVEVYKNHQVAKGKEVQISKNSEELSFVSDRALLNRILGNLTKNALEAIKPGQTVTLGCRKEGEKVAFWCQNPGVMPKETQLQMFLRSFSTKGFGRGVGTYSVKLLSEKYLDGKVSFVSKEETGTVFTVLLPMTVKITFQNPLVDK